MNPDVRDDAVLTTIGNLRAYEIGASRTQRIRSRCHAVLKTKAREIEGTDLSSWPQRIGPVLLGAWCLVYLFETIRLAMQIHIF